MQLSTRGRGGEWRERQRDGVSRERAGGKQRDIEKFRETERESGRGRESDGGRHGEIGRASGRERG